jgi:hypothetical protein
MKKMYSLITDLFKISTQPLVDAFKMFYKRPGMLAILGLCVLCVFFPITMFCILFTVFGLLFSV